MKHTYIILAATLMLAACTKENGQMAQTGSSLVAQTENGVKTHLSRESGVNKVYWDAGDQIDVFTQEPAGYLKSAFSTTETGTSVIFKGGGVTLDQNTYAIYPSAESNAFSAADGFTTEIHTAEQKVCDQTFAQKYNVAVGKCGEDNKTAFRNVGAYLKFTLTQERADTIRKIELKSNDGTPLAIDGAINIKWNAGDPTVAADQEAVTSDLVKLTAQGESFVTGETYYVWVVPGTYAGGITLTLTSPTQMTATKTSATSLSVARNQIVDLGEIGGLTYQEKQTEKKVLTFDFTGTATEGWPTADKWDKVEEAPYPDITCTYNLSGTNYDFLLTQCQAAVDARIAWTATGLTCYAAQRFVGLPVLSGWRLIKVVCTQGTTPKTTRKGAITSKVTETTDESYTMVSGGESQVWDVDTITYNLLDTKEGTMYYLTCTGGGIGTSVLALTYEKVD